MGKMANAADLILEPPSKQAEQSLSPSRYYGDRGFQFLYEQEYAAHQKQLEDVLDRMQALMNKSYTKEPQTKQVESMRHHWEGLTRFLDDPGIPLDNNLAERALRTPVVGRKNFYGNHSDRAAEATAIFYSIISSCKLHRIHPHKFLKRYLTAYVQIRGSPMPEEILESFLPHEYANRHPDDLVKEPVSADVNQ